MSTFTKRIRPQLILAVAALLLLAACTSESQTPNPIPRVVSAEAPPFNGYIDGGNIQRTGVYPGAGGPKFGDRLWKYKAEYALDSPVVVANSLAFMAVTNYGLQAIDLKTGEVKYTLDSYGTVPTVADGVLYYGSKDGLHAMDLATRKDNWVFKEAGGGSSPAVYAGVVYFGGGSATSDLGGKAPLVAVDAKTGQEKWRFDGGSVSAPAIGDGLIYVLGGETIFQADVGLFHGILYAVDLQTGKEVWHVEPTSTPEMPGTFGEPIYYDGLVYSASSYNAYLGAGHVYAFDAKTGKEVWKQTTADDLWDPKTPLAYQGLLYISARVPHGGTDQAPLYVFDAKTGAAKWTFRAGDALSEPAIANGILYICSSGNVGNRGALYSLDPATGQQLDRMEFEDGLGWRPALADGVVYVQGGSFEPVLEDVLIAVSTLPAEGSPGATVTAAPLRTSNGALYKGNLQRTGQYPATGVSSLAGERWTFQTGGRVDSSPVVAGGVVYAGSGDGSLYALDADAGRVRWQYQAASAISSSPAVADGKIFFGSADGTIYGLDARAGGELWKFKTGAGVAASPLVVDGLVICGSKDGSLYALDVATGQKVWVHRAAGAISVAAALADTTAYYGDAEGFFYGIDIKTGLARWKYAGQSAVASTPAVLNGVVYFGNQGGQLLALNAATGTEKWGFKLGTGGRNSRSPAVTGAPVVAGDTIYFGGDDGALYAVSVNSTQQLWRLGTGDVIHSAPSLAGPLIYVGSDDANLYAVEVATGKEQWRFKAANAIATSPAIGDGVLYFGSADGVIHALQAPTLAAQPTHTMSPDEAATHPAQANAPVPSSSATPAAPLHFTTAMTQGGPEHNGVYTSPPLAEPIKTLWEFNAGQHVNAPPVVADGVVYFASEGGRVYAVDAQTGLEKWSVHTGADEYLAPAVAGGRVYLGSASGTFYAYDAQTGKEQWHVAGARPDSAPAIAGNTIYFGSRDGNVYALDAGTSAVQWKFQTGDSVDSTPSVAEGVVYVGGRSNAVFALDAATGQQRWRFDTQNFIHCSPAVVDGIVYFGNWSGDFYAVEAKTGQQVWHFAAHGSIYNDLGVADGMVYFGTNGDRFYALDAKTGAERWSYPQEGVTTNTGEFQGPAIIDGLVYAVSEWKGIFAFDVKTGQIRWQYNEGFEPTAAYIADGILYIGDHGFPSHVYAIK